jgi:hypothetical protein
MTVKSSTGLAAHMMVTGAAKDALDGGSIRVLSGAAPATADAAETGDLIWEVKKDDGASGVEGLVWDPTAVGRSMVKPAADIWGGATVAGTAGYVRIVGPTDDGTESTTQPRIQGSVGSVAGVMLYMSSTTLITDTDVLAKTLAAFSVTLPTN